MKNRTNQFNKRKFDLPQIQREHHTSLLLHGLEEETVAISAEERALCLGIDARQTKIGNRCKAN